jgi:hypothetical protein
MVPENITPKGVAHPGVLDAFAYDVRRETLVLAMYETRPWMGGEPQLLQLQEKLNAYASFILDGEMTGSFPQYADKPVEIQLRTKHEPADIALRMLHAAREQLALQQIGLEIILVDSPEPSHACGCGHGGCGA